MRSHRVAEILCLVGLTFPFCQSLACAESPGPTSRPASTTAPAAEPADNDQKILDAIIIKQDPKLAMSLLKQAGEGDSGHSKGRDIALYYAVGSRGDMLDVAKELVRQGANVNSRGKGGFTPLHEACYSGSPEGVAFLISKGVDVNAVEDKLGSTPLHVMTITSCRDPEQVLNLLTSHGANINAVDKEGLTPLDMARSQARDDGFDVVKVLLAKGAKSGKELKAAPTTQH